MGEKEMVFWMIWEPQSGYIMQKHDTCSEAFREARRLASKDPNKRFYVLQALGFAQMMPLAVQEYIWAISLPYPHHQTGCVLSARNAVWWRTGKKAAK